MLNTYEGPAHWHFPLCKVRKKLMTSWGKKLLGLMVHETPKVGPFWFWVLDFSVRNHTLGAWWTQLLMEALNKKLSLSRLRKPESFNGSWSFESFAGPDDFDSSKKLSTKTPATKTRRRFSSTNKLSRSSSERVFFDGKRASLVEVAWWLWECSVGCKNPKITKVYFCFEFFL